MSMSMSMSGVERQSGISDLAAPMYLITQQVLSLVNPQHEASNDVSVSGKLYKNKKIDITEKDLIRNQSRMKELVEQAKESKKNTENILKKASYEKSNEANELMLTVKEIKENCEQILFALRGYDGEVLDLIKRKQSGEYVFPEYDGNVYGNPLNFLRKYFSKYLKFFGADDDFLYQDQLAKIMGENFVQALRSHIKRNENFDMNYFVPKKSVRMAKKALLVSPQELEKSIEIYSLYASGLL